MVVGSGRRQCRDVREEEGRGTGQTRVQTGSGAGGRDRWRGGGRVQ